MTEFDLNKHYEAISAFQKCIRRGMEQEAYQFASIVENVNPRQLWDRIKIITSEDVGPANPTLPATIATLEKWYFEQIGRGNSGGRLHLVNAILILCRSAKCRDTDNTLIVNDIKMKEGFVPETPDWALDKHTRRGKAMGRGFEHFFSEGVKCNNDQTNIELQNHAAELIKTKGSPVDWKMAKLARFKTEEKKQMRLDDC